MRAVAGGRDAVRRAGRHQRVEDLAGVADRHVQLPAELADIGDAERPHRRAGDRRSRGHAPKGKAALRHVGVGDRGEHVAGAAAPSATACRSPR